MGTQYEVIDESGDLVIILRCRTQPLSWLDEDYDANQDTNEDTDEDTIEDVEEDLLLAEVKEELEGLESDQKLPVRAADTDTEPQTLLEQDFESTEQPAGDVDNEDLSGDDDDLEPEHKFLVSSHVLRLASKVFRKDLDPNGPWRQPEIQSDGLRDKYLESFNPEALKHVLNVIHFRNDQVPDKLEKEELAEVAVIVDYFQCHEAMRFAVKSWIGTKRIEEVVNDAKPGRPLILWLLIASVFGIDAIIKAAAKTFIEHNEGPFESMGLPIAENITSRMNSAQEAIIKGFIGNMYQLKNDLSACNLSSSHSICRPSCEILALGALQQKMWSEKLYPRPEAPYYGFSVSGIRSMIQTYKSTG
ncbi:hypothetical protein MY3296_008337 [Beauveria thailandica]